MKISNNTIVITGGARGIGLALTKKLIDNNNKVIVIGRKTNIPSEIQKYTDRVIFKKCNLANEQEFDSLLIDLENNYPEINVLINNAAIQHNYSFLEQNELNSRIDAEIATNLIAPIKLAANLIPLLANKEEAAIVNISSALAFTPKENASVYCATKAAIHSFSQSLRYQLEKTTIKVFELMPPLVNTDMTRGRGQNKIEPEVVAQEFLKSFVSDKYEINIGKIKILKILYRLTPGIVKKIFRNSK